jgi:hypothetical protein
MAIFSRSFYGLISATLCLDGCQAADEARKTSYFAPVAERCILHGLSRYPTPLAFLRKVFKIKDLFFDTNSQGIENKGLRGLQACVRRKLLKGRCFVE